jgi:hypothetical protein
MNGQFQPAGVMPTPAPAMQPTPAPVSYEATRQPDYNELMAYYNASQANQEVRVQPSVHSATQNASQPQPHEIVQQHVEPSIDFSDASCTSITLKLDGESLKILMDANEIFRETIVNMGIKLASQTPIYREFFRFKDLRVTSGSIGGVNTPVGTGIGSVTDVTTVATVSAPVVVPNTVAGSAPAKKKSTGFTTWG